MKKFYLTAITFGLVALLSANLVLAKGAWSKVEISGDGIPGVIDITDPGLLEVLALATFEDVMSGSIDPPEVVGGGYKMLRGWDDARGTFMPFDEVHYYLDPAGGPGYLYYVGLVDGSSEFDHHWYRVTQNGEDAIQKFFTDNDIQV